MTTVKLVETDFTVSMPKTIELARWDETGGDITIRYDTEVNGHTVTLSRALAIELMTALDLLTSEDDE